LTKTSTYSLPTGANASFFGQIRSIIDQLSRSRTMFGSKPIASRMISSVCPNPGTFCGIFFFPSSVRVNSTL